MGLSPRGDALAGWRLYPNPATEQVTVESPRAARGTNARLIVRDAQGRILQERAVNTGRIRLDLRMIAAQHVFISASVPGEGEVSLGQLNIVH